MSALGDRMNYSKIVGRIASAFGVSFVIFATLYGFVAYEQLTIQYSQSGIPAIFVWVSVLGSMLPSMLYAVLSFVVAGFISRIDKGTDKKDDTLPAEAEVTETPT